MRIVGIDSLSLDFSGRETLDLMSKWDRNNRRDSESAPGGVGESSELAEENPSGRARGGWMNYRMPPRDYAQRLSSFAWAQAVQNKPLGLDMLQQEVEELEFDVSGQEGEVEKEEGEIEEGEIESGSEMEPLVEEKVVGGLDGKLEEDGLDKKVSVDMEVESEMEDISELDKLVGFILEELDTITVEEAEASFDDVCGKLHNCFENLKTMFRGVESADTVVIALVQQALEGIQIVYSVLNSENSNNKQHNKDMLLRLLVRIKNHYSFLLSPEQVKEIDDLLKLMVFEDNNREKESSQSAGDVNKPALDSGLSFITDQNSKNSLVPSGMTGLPKLDMSFRAGFSPLLDLHAEHDEGSLPSPTRDNPVQFPTRKPIGYEIRTSLPSQPKTAKNAEVGTNQYYVTEAVKAVSSYEQKYGNISFPESPTPSEERNVDNDDSFAEISSSTISSNTKAPNHPSSQLQLRNSNASNTLAKSTLSNQVDPVKLVDQLGLGTKPTAMPPSKSRDPRLRLLKPEISGALESTKHVDAGSESRNGGLVSVLPNNKKQKAFDDTVIEDHALKRQRSEFNSSRELQMQSGSHANPQPINTIWSNEIDGQKQGAGVDGAYRGAPINNSSLGVNGSNQQNDSNAPAVSLPNLLKGFNPTILMQLVKMEQQRLAAGIQQQPISSQATTNTSIANVLPGTGSSVTSNTVLSNEGGITASGPQMPAQAASLSFQNNGGRRMKLRDPRRILHNITIQKSGILDSEHLKNGAGLSDTLRNTSSTGNLSSREQVDLDQCIPKHGVNRQLSKNLKHLAGTVSTSQQTTITTSPLAPLTSQSVTGQTNQAEINLTCTDLNDSRTSSLGASQGASIGTLQLANSWGDVDQLLDGFDDEQKATIQRERARRIEEQNKMFAARKLCLVLDLDHTLLNSAKFVEIDPIHEEILRRKEDIDKEKPLRHLFRFQHMGMWTKLRPGVWNFLEKASKLFELHLYTMGNKLYATEMAKVLDPTGNLFSGRVLSKGDDTDSLDGDDRVPKSKDLEGVLGMESAVLIIDDSVRVWPHNKHNLIVVERYTYFPCSRRQFGLLGPSLLEIDHDERPEDGTLAAALSVIERIHQTFFSHALLNEVDVRNILAAEKRKILAGCKIVFSRIIPVAEANPHLHPLWQTAEQFGAVCSNLCDDTVTHVVAHSLGTDKVNWAYNKKKFVVHPGWLEASALLYRRANENDFAVTQLP